MALKVIQNTKINTGDFIFSSPETVTYPVAPLISAKFYSPNGVLTLKIRATLYINSEDPNNPTVEAPAEINNSLQLYFDYNFSEETPESCDVWYVELDYTSDTVEQITSITSFLRDIDPETSRGTTTNIP
ncbi:MAG TPA: hypothetical protein PLO52_05590 [Flavobacterium alvei]|uniref:hypothetical protein n=1 Tax=Flavobacterium alvei TaxID=2080416 RepID=UPI0026ECC776|nr:hypothetical protein [Flavobacterium alvei]HQE34100.1 hypothetical protein [Flavobacterium alvei]HQF48418.1 hypothetical protein [Flavobacterium alvei]HQK39571.1 hypothetical protein [Flavobacterium alvei]